MQGRAGRARVAGAWRSPTHLPVDQVDVGAGLARVEVLAALVLDCKRASCSSVRAMPLGPIAPPVPCHLLPLTKEKVTARGAEDVRHKWGCWSELPPACAPRKDSLP